MNTKENNNNTNNLSGIWSNAKAEQFRRKLLGGPGSFLALAPKEEDIRFWQDQNREPLVDASHNNYYGESSNSAPEVIRARVNNAITPESLQSEVFRVSGDNAHEKLKNTFKKLLGATDVFLTSSGYMANMGIMQALAKNVPAILLDEQAHESFDVAAEAVVGHVAKKVTKHLAQWYSDIQQNAIQDHELKHRLGSVLKKASGIPQAHRFAHNSPEALQDCFDRYGSGVVVLEGMYSLSGAVLNIEVARLARKLGYIIVLDESHSLGGTVCDSFSVTEMLRGHGIEVDVVTASLSKAIGEKGGLVAVMPGLIKKASAFYRSNTKNLSTEEKHLVRQDILYGMRICGPFAFTNATDVSGIYEKLELLIQSEFLKELRQKAAKVKAELQRAHIPVEPDSPLIFIKVPKKGDRHSEECARLFRDWLIRERGVLGSLYFYPGTPPGHAGVRFVLNNDMTEAALKRLTGAIIDGYRYFGFQRNA